MINYQTITIDLQPDYREPVVQMYLSERDVGRPIQVNVLMQGQPYSFTAGTTVHIDLRKPSGHVVQVNGNYAVGSNVVLFNVVEQMAAEPGMCLTELSIVGDGQDPIGSKNWLTKVELSPMHAGDPSETWIEDLDELVQDAMEGHIDATLSIPGDAADAAAVGEELADLKSAIEQIEPGLSNDAKTALLNCFQHVAWIDEHGQTYYDALESALYADSYPKITAQFNPGLNVIYTDDTLDSLKQYLTVKYFETEESAGTVIASADYSLSGTLTEGASTVFVSYSGLTTSFVIDEVVDFYNIWEWKPGDNTMTMQSMTVDANQTDETMYPSRVTARLPFNQRRSFPVGRGKSPYYAYRETAVAMPYYPVPIPAGANHIQIKCQSSVFFFMHTVQLDPTTLQYANSINIVTWTQIATGGVIDKDIVNPGNLFMILNSKYDAAGTSYPVDPVGVEIIFSEV